ncbi:hypothetical protein RDABS01_039829, partial [Bienertia sinuspersici]
MAYYSMQSSKIPKTVCDDIDRRTRRFIWGGDEEKRKVHLLSWDTVQKPRALGGIGIKSARQVNAAFLTKLGWRVLTEPNALWSRVLRQKYCRGRCDIDMFKATTNMSNVWSGIIENAGTIRKGSSIAVGNGQRTLFWDHSWATDLPLSSEAIQTIPESIEGATVSEMWDASTGWKWDLFGDYLPSDILKRIASHELVEDMEAGDLVYWKGSTHGKFSIKYALKIIRNEESPSSNNQWELVWRAPVQQRIRAFMWLLMHDRLMSNANRVKRRISDDPGCPRCGGPEETLLHLFRDCPIAQNIWRSVGGPACYSSFFLGDIHQWVAKNLRAEGLIYAKIWPTSFAVTLWWIWRWRNCIMFNREREIPVIIQMDNAACIQSLLKEDYNGGD